MLTTIVLSACVLVHGHDDSNDGWFSDFPFSNEDSPDSSETDSNDFGIGPMLGQRAPQTGRLGEPCDGDRCNSGLYCKIKWHDGGSYSTGTCQRERTQAGGENQRCRTVQEGSPCNSGLRCERVRIYPSGHTNICRKVEPEPGQEGQRCRTDGTTPCNSGLRCQRVQLLPSGHRDICQRVTHTDRGEANQRCNDAPLAPCNHNNLRPHYERMYPSGESCICHFNFGASGNSDTDSADDSNPKLGASNTGGLGLVAPQMGGEGEPCRNTDGPWSQCNWGLECDTRWHDHHSYSTGTCVRSRPAPTPVTPHMGRQGEPCRNGDSWPYTACDSGLECSRWTDGSASYGICLPYGPAPTPTPPSPQPSNCGNAGQKCCSKSSCKYGCDAVTNWEHLYGQALEVPVCRCQQSLGDGSTLGGDPFNGDSTKSNADDGSNLGMAAPQTGGEGEPCDGNRCDAGLFCRHTTDGSATFGTCRQIPSGHGGDGERCYAAPLSPCKTGLKSHEVEGLCMCEYWLGAGDSKTSGDGPKLGLVAPDLGTYGNGCRNGSDGQSPCDFGLYCSRWREGTATMGKCELIPTPPTPGPCGESGERCCGNSYCEYGLKPVWDHQRGQALEVCRCEAILYGAGAAPSGGN